MQFSKCGGHSLLCVSSPQNDRMAQGGAKDSCSLGKKGKGKKILSRSIMQGRKW